jgi:DNA polymerase
MLAYRLGKQEPVQWILDLQTYRQKGIYIPECPSDLRDFIEDPRIEFHAHNAAFERYVWNRICCEKWGWPQIPMDRWHCTAAKGSAANQPRALDTLCQRLEVGQDNLKDKEGKRLINLLSKPQKVTKKVRTQLIEDGVPLFTIPGKPGEYYWNEDPQLMADFAAYNLQDIKAERAADLQLPSLPPDERKLWLVDREINERGIPIDIPLCEGAIKVYQRELELANEEIARIAFDEDLEAFEDKDLTKTGKRKPTKQVTACTQRERILKWVNQRVDFGETLQDGQITEWLEEYRDQPGMEDVNRVLELRQMAGGTAVSKYQAALDFVEEDGRCRDQILYYGAATGRWTGKGVQPHNFKRAATPDETFMEAIASGSHDMVRAFGDLEGKTVLDILKACVRGLVKAPDGWKLVVSDFAGIESRVLNWLCGNEIKLDLYRRSQDAYIHTALDVFDTTYEEIADWNGKKWKIKKEHGEKRQIGKSCELGLGYGMGWRTFQANAARAGSVLSDEFAEEVVNKWRGANHQIPDLWRRVERAFRFAVKQKNRSKRQAARLDRLMMGWDPRGYAFIQLPSGRRLYYYQARFQEEENDLIYLDGSKKSAASAFTKTYGGKLVENIVQAVARDLLVYSIFLIKQAGLEVIFHVHDEAVALTRKEDTTAFGIVHEAMSTCPPWAAGLPLEAETYEAERYTK